MMASCTPCSTFERQLATRCQPKLPSRRQQRMLARIARRVVGHPNSNRQLGARPHSRSHSASTRQAARPSDKGVAATQARGSGEPSCSDQRTWLQQAAGLAGDNNGLQTAAIAVAVAGGALGLMLLLPAAAHAGESLPFELVGAWLEEVEALGPWGAAFFVGTVVLAELIPLFPTQPLALAGGLLFGPVKGATLVLFATCVAAVAAFSISRTLGADFAKRLLKGEIEEGGGSVDDLLSSMSSSDETDGSDKLRAGPSNPIERALANVYQAVEAGGFGRQAAAILLLRLTPVVPFSAGNYLLGLTPLPYAPFIAGSAAGMALWSFLYASVGGASRALLLRGANAEELFADMAEKASGYTTTAAAIAVGAGVLLGGVYAVRKLQGNARSEGGGATGGEGRHGQGGKLVKERVAPSHVE